MHPTLMEPETRIEPIDMEPTQIHAQRAGFVRRQSRINRLIVGEPCLSGVSE